MTREQLRLRYIGTVRLHWRSSFDQSGPTPAYLDDLVQIAVDYAEATRAAETKAAPPVAAIPDQQAPDVMSATPAEGLPRTRTRTRRGEPA